MRQKRLQIVLLRIGHGEVEEQPLVPYIIIVVENGHIPSGSKFIPERLLRDASAVVPEQAPAQRPVGGPPGHRIRWSGVIWSGVLPTIKFYGREFYGREFSRP